MAMNFNVIFTPGDFMNGIITVVNEIPMGSCMKIEYDKDKHGFVLDRVEPMIFAKPTNYGFIPQTMDDDGDELDVLLITREPLGTGIVVEARILGVLEFEDDGEMDHKVVAVPADDRDSANAIESLDDLSAGLKNQIEYHFNHYKDLKKPGTTKVIGWGDIEKAKEVIQDCIDRYNK